MKNDPQEKTILKKPSLIRVNICFLDAFADKNLYFFVMHA